MKSTLVNMVAVLFTITLVASAGVGYVNMITVGPIAEAKAAATQSALRAVLPSFDRTETTELTLDELPVAVHTARSGEAVVGYAVETASKNGFIGTIRELLGSGAVFGYSLGTADYMPLVFVLAPGGFLVLGYLMVVFNKLAKK